MYTVCFMSICNILESQIKPRPKSTFPDRTEESRQFFSQKTGLQFISGPSGRTGKQIQEVLDGESWGTDYCVTTTAVK